MAAPASRSARSTELQMPRRWKDRQTSPERNKVWTEPHHNRNKHSDGRVPVIYYLARSGQLEHPHFMEVPLSSSDGLYLADVINRLNVLRGNGLAFMYSWSCKRSYKNGYVWHDLTENDFIYPAHGQEYILKGSELLEGALISKCDEAVLSTSFRKPPPECQKHDDNHNFPTRRRNQSWSSSDFSDYKLYAAESRGISVADASIQADEIRRRRRAIREIEAIEEDRRRSKEALGNNTTEICAVDEISEISPPPSDSSPETLEALIKADGRMIVRSETVNENKSVSISSQLNGRAKASTVLMQLFSCGSIGFSDCGPGGYGKGSAVCVCPHQKPRLPRGERRNQVRKDAEEDRVGSLVSGFGGRLKLEDKGYFSGSLIETKKEEFPALKRSSSYNTDRRLEMELTEKEEEEEVGDGGKRRPECEKERAQAQHKEPSCSSSHSVRKYSNNRHCMKRRVVYQT